MSTGMAAATFCFRLFQLAKEERAEAAPADKRQRQRMTKGPIERAPSTCDDPGETDEDFTPQIRRQRCRPWPVDRHALEGSGGRRSDSHRPPDCQDRCAGVWRYRYGASARHVSEG